MLQRCCKREGGSSPGFAICGSSPNGPRSRSRRKCPGAKKYGEAACRQGRHERVLRKAPENCDESKTVSLCGRYGGAIAGSVAAEILADNRIHGLSLNRTKSLMASMVISS